METNNFNAEITSLFSEIKHYCVEKLKTQHNGLLRCTNENNDSMYCLLYEYGQAVVEKRILALSVKNNALYVLPDYGGYEECNDIDNVSDEELLNSEEWSRIDGGELVEGQTLLSIIDAINEY